MGRLRHGDSDPCNAPTATLGLLSCCPGTISLQRKKWLLRKLDRRWSCQHLFLLHPLRYRLADKANAALKRGLGPAHGLVRSGVSKAGAVYRRMKEPGAAYSFIRWVVIAMPLIGPASRSVVRRAVLEDAHGEGAVTDRTPQKESDTLSGNSDCVPGRWVSGLARGVSFVRAGSASGYSVTSEWFRATRPSPKLLAKLRSKRWTAKAPKISVIMPVHNAARRLAQTGDRKRHGDRPTPSGN